MGGAARLGEQRWALPVIQGGMIGPDGMVMRDSPAIRNHGVERRALDCEPLRAELARLAERVDREIGRGAVGIDMREAAGHLALTASRLKDRVRGRSLDRILEFFKALPRDRGP